MTRIISLSATDTEGGAARAAYRIHKALMGREIDSRMLVNHATSGDLSVEGPASSVRKRIRELIAAPIVKLLGPNDNRLYSPSIVPSRWAKRLNVAQADLVHMHWVNDEMLSIRDIARLRKPVVWTLHDMWAFCGAEHYNEDDRWVDGYRDKAGAFDLNRWVWRRKRRHWRRPMHIVTPSHWLAECVRQSELMRHWPVEVIHNPIDVNVWRPVDQSMARDVLGLPTEEPILVYGAAGGTMDPRKGFDLLCDALQQLEGSTVGIRVGIFGQSDPGAGNNSRLNVNYLGRLYDDISLRLVYSAADAVVIPSRQDNLPNAGVEAMACGTPVIAFNTGGLPDIVDHKRSGYLAKAFDTHDLATGIEWVLSSARDSGKGAGLSLAARNTAEQKFAYDVVAEQYIALYRSILD